MTLLELYRISEMARTRGDAAWKVLDWAARQEGDFTVRDAYRVYAAAGGESTEQQFATIFNKWVAKYDPRSSKDRYRDQESYGLSQARPIVVTRQGRRGKGGAATYQWGLDGPLRQPPPDDGTMEVVNDEFGAALDRLEGHLGNAGLKQRWEAWKRLPDMNAVMRDVMRLPARLQAAAMLVASSHLVKSGEADRDEVEDMQARLDARPDTAAAATGTPFSPGNPKVGLPQDGRPGFRPRPAPTSSPAAEPESDGSPEVDDDPSPEWEDDQADRTQPDAASPFSAEEGDPPTDGDEGDEGDDGGGEASDEGEAGEDAAEYPAWTPPPDEQGAAAEQAMHRLVNDHGMAPDDPFWDAVVGAEDSADVRRIAMANWSGRPKQGFQDALAVAMFGLDNAFESPEGSDDEELEPETDQETDDPTDEVDADVVPDDAPPDGDDTPVEAPDWLPVPNEDGTGAESAMYDVLSDMPKAAGFEGFAASPPLFTELRGAKDINDAYTVLLRAGVPKIMLKKFLRVAREVFAHDGRDPETGERIREGLGRLLGVMEAALEDDAAELDPIPDPSRRGAAGVTRLLPMYGMDEGPNTEPVDFAPKSGLARIMRIGRGR